MNEALIFGLLFLAVASGWILGRRAKRDKNASAIALPSQYYRGLNYLLDGRPDGAVDHFISALEVNSETLETHIALGNVLRRRGEVDRAIRIHQNLLARPNLSQAQIHIAHLELARDYVSAGLLDRAEKLLIDLVAESEEQREISCQHLIELYRSESEWTRAIEIAKTLLPKKSLLKGSSDPIHLPGQPIGVQLAHFYCEQAGACAASGQWNEARNLLEQALAVDPACVRASLDLGRLEASMGNHREAIKALRRVVDQDPGFLAEAIPALRESYAALEETSALSKFLKIKLEEHPSTPLTIAVAEDVLRERGHDAARQFLAERLAESPSLRGLRRWIRLQDEAVTAEPDETVSVLSVLLDRLIAERAAYCCGHCGFESKQLLWFCPGCKYWGSFGAINRSEST
ncbi:MAG: lipopolysaccharide assembly protein LapB [Pseudomonadota bacterium]